jgi:hypothetical protein
MEGSSDPAGDGDAEGAADPEAVGAGDADGVCAAAPVTPSTRITATRNAVDLPDEILRIGIIVAFSGG